MLAKKEKTLLPVAKDIEALQEPIEPSPQQE